MSSPIRPGWLSGGRFGRPKGTVEEQRQAEGLDRYIRRDRQQPGDLAPARRHQAGRIEAGVCVFMLCVIGTVFDEQDDPTGKNNLLGNFNKAGSTPAAFKAIWD